MKVCAFGSDVANHVARPLEGARLYGEDVRKDEDDQFGWKAGKGVDRVVRWTDEAPHFGSPLR